MSVNNVINNANKMLGLNPTKITKKFITKPHIDAAHDALLRDKKANDAIKACLSPSIKKTFENYCDPQINIKNWKESLKSQLDKPENRDIKKDFEKNQSKVDFTKFPKFNTNILNKVIENLKNRQQWLKALQQDEDVVNNYLTQVFENKLIDCFPNKKKIQSIPKYNKTNLETQKTKVKKVLDDLEQNQKIFDVIKSNLGISLYNDADVYKIESIKSWEPLIESLKTSDKYEDKLVLNDLLLYINNSVIEDRKLIQEAKDKKIPNAYPKKIIPFFNEELFEKAIKMKGNQPFMNHYEVCYRDNIIQKYSLHYDKDGIAITNKDNFYHLDLNKKREDTSDELHENELQFISPDSWCTKSFNSKQYKEFEHFYIILDQKKKVKIGSGYDSSSNFYEITDENNCIDSIDINLLKQISDLYNHEELKKIKKHNLGHNLSLLVLYSILTKNNYYNKLSEIQNEDEKNKFVKEVRNSYRTTLQNLNLETLTKYELIKGLMNLQSKEYINLNNVKLSLELLELDSTLDEKTIDEIRNFNQECYIYNRLNKEPDYEELGFPNQDLSLLNDIDIVSLPQINFDFDYEIPDLTILDDIPVLPPINAIPLQLI